MSLQVEVWCHYYFRTGQGNETNVGLWLRRDNGWEVRREMGPLGGTMHYSLWVGIRRTDTNDLGWAIDHCLS